MAGYEAQAEIDVAAPTDEVWRALTDPTVVARYMWGTTLDTRWEVGGPISWRGEFEGRPYEDTGTVLEVVPGERLVVTHSSALGGSSTHTLTYTLEPSDAGTHLTLHQDGAGSPDEAEHSRTMWQGMLASLKDVVERG